MKKCWYLAPLKWGIALGTLSIGLCGSLNSLAGTPPQSDKNLTARVVISRTFNLKFGVLPDEVNLTPIPGIYQIVSGTRIAYMDASAKYFIDGDAFTETADGTNLSAAKKKQLSSALLKKFNLNDAVKVVHGSGAAVLYTFEDANCSFCKKLAPELAKLHDVTIYTFIVSFLGDDSTDKARKIWCSKDKSATWFSFMAGSANPLSLADDSCDSSTITRNTDLAKKMAVQGTPAIFFRDGSSLPGYVVSSTIKQRLDDVQ